MMYHVVELILLLLNGGQEAVIGLLAEGIMSRVLLVTQQIQLHLVERAAQRDEDVTSHSAINSVIGTALSEYINNTFHRTQISSQRSYLTGHAGFAVEHQAVRGELGGRVHRGPEERQDRIHEVVPLGLLLRHHLPDGVLQQGVGALQKAVVLDLQLQTPALAQLLAHLRQEATLL